MRKFNVGYNDWCKLANDFIAHGKEVTMLDCRDGSLQDYFLCDAGDFLIGGFEHYDNPWSSSIDLFVAQTDGDKEKLQKKWDKFITAYDAEYGTDDEVN